MATSAERCWGDRLHGAVASTFAGLDLSLLAKLASLSALPFAHEDLAIVAGAYIIVNKLMPASLVALSLYGGIVASDFALYGIGAGARRLPWLNRFAISGRIESFGDTLRRNIFGLVALCRVVPGVVFVAFIACGWARVSLARFTIASLLVSALYLPLMLYLAIVFGDALDDRVGLWAWPALFVALGATGYMRKRVFAFASDRELAGATEPATPAARPADHRGMPALERLAGQVAPAERIPPALFYVPLVANWLWLGLRHRGLTLPSACNPAIPTGGMWGESKSDCLDQVAPSERTWLAEHVVLHRGASVVHDTARALQLVGEAGITFPLIAKPDIGWHGHGVQRIDHPAQLRAYVANYPQREALILQRFVPYAGEAALLYARVPGAPRGGVISLALRYFPHVVGDGRSTIRDLIRNDPRARWKAHLHFGFDRSHRGLSRRELDSVPGAGAIVQIATIGNQRAGGLYRDARHCITPELVARFDGIARSMPEFHYGRFDLRFASIDALMRAEDFAVIEINGIGGEAIDVWDPALSVGETYRRLLAQQRLLFMIGERNRARGFVPTPTIKFLADLAHQTRLIRRYPASS